MSTWNREHATTFSVSTVGYWKVPLYFYFCGEANILPNVAGSLETFLTCFGEDVVCCTTYSTLNNLSTGREVTSNRDTQE
jgi:hypothetical protein